MPLQGRRSAQSVVPCGLARSATRGPSGQMARLLPGVAMCAAAHCRGEIRRSSLGGSGMYARSLAVAAAMLSTLALAACDSDARLGFIAPGTFATVRFVN